MIANYALAFLLGFIIGVASSSVYEVSSAVLVVIGAWSLFGVLVSLVIYSPALLIVFCASTGIILGCWHLEHSVSRSEFESLYYRSFDSEGLVAEDSQLVERNQQLTIQPDRYSQKLRATLYQPIDAQKGDRVWLRGVIEPPENFSEFDYIGYLQRRGVYAVLKKPRIIVLEPASKISISSWASSIRSYILGRSRKLYNPEQGSLITGMLIGQQQKLPEETDRAFRIIGMTHIVAVSGYNMTIIASACMLFAAFLGRRVTGILTIVLVVSFAFIAGGSASVVRAAIMSLLVVTAQLSGRMYTSNYALVWAASIMVLHNPRIVWWDVGFQLSVLATLGVLYSYRIRDAQSEYTLSFDVLRPTLGAILATAPLIAYHFQTLSVVALPANIILLPLVPWIMLFGALSYIPMIGGVSSIIANALASMMVWVAEQFTRFPYASLQIDVSPVAVLGMYCIAYVLLQIIINKKQYAGLSVASKYGKL